LFTPFGNLLSQHSVARRTKNEGLHQGEIKNRKKELAQIQRPLTATEYGLGGNPFVAFVIFCKKYQSFVAFVIFCWKLLFLGVFAPLREIFCVPCALSLLAAP
jgi:hypothetical protein